MRGVRALFVVPLAGLLLAASACTNDTTPGPTGASGATGTASPATSGVSHGSPIGPGSTSSGGTTTPGSTPSTPSTKSPPASKPASSPPATSPPLTGTSSSPLPPGPPDSNSLSGTWNGTWTDDQNGSTNSLQFTFTQDGSTLDGTITMDGTSCLSGGVADGEAHGNRLRITVNQREARLVFDGTVSATTMSGTYTSTCEAPTGTWQATKSRS